MEALAALRMTFPVVALTDINACRIYYLSLLYGTRLVDLVIDDVYKIKAVDV